MKASKATIAKLEADELKGTMHRAEDVAALTEDLVYTIRGALNALPGRLAVDVAAVSTPAEASEVIPVVLSGLKEKDRRQLMSDHAQGLYIVSSVLHCALSDLGGVQPERGQRIRINDQEGGGGFFREFYVASSVCEMGMLRVELEAVDE